MPTTTILVAGLGSIGQRHARLLSERSDVKLLLCDPVQAHCNQAVEKLHRKPDGTFNDYDQALAARPNLVMVCTPNSLHVPMGNKALEAGSDVMLEKPISHAFEPAGQIVALAHKLGRKLHVGYMLRFEHGLRKIKQMVSDGALGNIAGGRAMIGTYITLLNGKTPERINTPYAIVVDYTHELDFIRWILGSVSHVMAMAATRGELELQGSPNIIQTLMTLDNGALVQVHMDFIQHPQRRIFEIYGDKGAVAYDFMAGELRHFSFGAQHIWQNIPQDLDPVQRWDNLYRDQIQSMIDACQGNTPPTVNGEDGIEALRIAHAIIRTAESGEAVVVRDVK
jgi:predicted dehydrogenase